MIALLIIIVYILLVLVAYGLVLYFDWVDESISVMVSIFWPCVIVIIICVYPFEFVEKQVKKAKEKKKLKEINSSYKIQTKW